MKLISKKIPKFLVDSSVLKEMLEGKETTLKVLERMEMLQNNCPDMKLMLTTVPSFLKALRDLENPSPTFIKDLHIIMDVVGMVGMTTDIVSYRDEKTIMTDMIDLVNRLNGGRKKDDKKRN